jgi:hypothetical protein
VVDVGGYQRWLYNAPNGAQGFLPCELLALGIKVKSLSSSPRFRDQIGRDVCASRSTAVRRMTPCASLAEIRVASVPGESRATAATCSESSTPPTLVSSRDAGVPMILTEYAERIGTSEGWNEGSWMRKAIWPIVEAAVQLRKRNTIGAHPAYWNTQHSVIQL